MKLLLTCNTMCYCSGSPLYNFTLAMELARTGHSVTFLSEFDNWPIKDAGGTYMKIKLEEVGVRCINVGGHDLRGDYAKFDIAFVSQQTEWQLATAVSNKVVNIIHSEYDCEQPCDANTYVAIRPSIKERLMVEFGIPTDRISIIYNGIDRERFNLRTTRIYDMPYERIVIPCTLDSLREKFLNYYIERATESLRVEIYGEPCGAVLKTNKYVTIYPSTFHIEQVMENADYVAGILLGRINLEACSLGITSFIHDPINPENYEMFMLSDSLFDKRHNITSVAKELISL